MLHIETRLRSPHSERTAATATSHAHSHAHAHAHAHHHGHDHDHSHDHEHAHHHDGHHQAEQAAKASPGDGCELELALPFEQRIRSRLRTQLSSGEAVGILLPRGSVLHDGDVLQAEDGRLLTIRAASESLVEVRSEDPLALARAAYHLGNRHVAVEVGQGYLRLAPDKVLQDLLSHLGLTCQALNAPFHPEMGAYGSAHSHGAEQLPGTPRIHDHHA